MKKALVILLALTMVMSMFAMLPFGASATEEELAIGEVAADYKPEGTAIKTAEEFAAMAADGQYYLANDITVSATYANDFIGTFDGNGKTITTSVALFAALDGTVKNLNIDGNIVYDVETTEFDAKGYTGALANIAGHTAPTYITNVVNKAPLTVNVGAGAGLVGLLSLDQKFEIIFTDCANYGNVTGGKSGDNGGLAGLFNGVDNVDEYYLQFINCYNYGTINAAGRPGGIIGYANASTKFVDCYNAGDIQSTANYCGGIAGRIGTDSGTGNIYLFENCVNDGNVSVYQKHGGGMVGYIGEGKSLIFKNCTNNGDIVYTEATLGKNKNVQVGGLWGSMREAAHREIISLDGCVNNGTIGATGASSTAPKGTHDVGGLGGLLTYTAEGDVKVTNCVNNGEVVATLTTKDKDSTGYAGGIIGRFVPVVGKGAGYVVDINFVGCINNGEVSAVSQAGGIIGHTFSGANNAYINFISCGNAGEVTAVGEYKPDGTVKTNAYAGGITAEVTVNDAVNLCNSGANVISCFNVGKVHSETRFAAGLVAITRQTGVIEMKYNYVAGEITGKAINKLTLDSNNQAKITNFEEAYAIDTKNNGTVYFHAPYNNAIATLEADDSITITVTSANYDKLKLTSIAHGGSVSLNKNYTFTTDDGKVWIFYSPVNGTVSIPKKYDGKPVVTVSTANGAVEMYVAEWTAESDNITFKNWNVISTPINSQAYAFIWCRMNSYDLSENYVAEGLEIFNAYKGFGNCWGSLGDYGYEAKTFAKAELASGALAYKLNKDIGEDTFRQNLVAELFEVDAYPTTDQTHAKVVPLGQGYTNFTFNTDDASGSPATGDATIYVVVALAVSTISLAAVAVARKNKEN